ncbi:hypothetical protein CORT_0F03470 [Candida orthopsilosis Co 90-125]|uniref:Uncharacterized protein n=1 Tax=Candida orthopsilosis (strain 90-125) TaxID=1136231 RepID=H8X9A6_CANO9|nr:hypothetical protein CORT_0F03470 [Candida orthopsilosis Co 90-125]CCG24571.1 hypothetical protein CORT_0F03470 [Candida orthopsilosis Co 90-125]
MSEFSKFKKADLSQVLKRLGIRTTAKDVKKVLVEKLDAYLAKNPKDVNAVKKFLEEVGANEVDEEEVTVIEAGDDDDDDSDDDEEDSEDDDADEEEEEERLEAILVEEEDEDDKDYQAPPPLNLKEFILDPIIATSENAIDKFYELTDSVGITYLEHTEKLRDQLSSTITLNFLELGLEFLIYLYNFTNIVPLNENKLIHQFFHDNIPLLAKSQLPSLELIGLFDFKAIATFATWVVFAIISPSIISYFINFTSRVIDIEDDEYLLRIYSFDPFIFALAKILVYYFVGQSSIIEFATTESWASALWNKALLHLGLYHTFAATLGTLPYVLGGVNVLIALYSQFEEY